MHLHLDQDQGQKVSIQLGLGVYLASYFPRDALHSAVSAIVRCLSVHLSVRHTLVFYDRSTPSPLYV